MDKTMIANKALADELDKRFRFIRKAYHQIQMGNYGIAKRLLGKALNDEFQIKVYE